MKYEYFSLSLISFIVGLLVLELSPIVIGVPIVFNLLWYTYSFFFVLGFVGLGMLVWSIFGALCYGFCYGTGVVFSQYNNYALIKQIHCNNKRVPSTLRLYTKEALVPGSKLNFSCYFYGNKGKLLKIYKQQVQKPDISSTIRNYLKDKISLSSQSEFLYTFLLGEPYLGYNSIIHLFAISGLHISILMFYVRLALKYVLSLSFFISYGCNVNLISTIGSLLVAGLYAMVTNKANILRSIVMCAVAFLIPRIDTKKSLIIAVFLLLIYNPNYVFDRSFQMSALATFGILCSTNSIILQQLYINTMILPFTQVISPFGAMLNIVLIPLSSIALLMSIILIHSEKTIWILDYFIHILVTISKINLPVIHVPMNKLNLTIYILLIALSIFKERVYLASLGFFLNILINC